MATNISNHSPLSKLGALLFARQAPNLSAPTHPSLFSAFQAWRARRAAEAELAQMPDRALADIGLTRQGIKDAVRVHRQIR